VFNADAIVASTVRRKREASIRVYSRFLLHVR